MANCTSFGKGVYVLTGLSSFTGNSTTSATGVTFVLTCSTRTGNVTLPSLCAPGQTGGSIEVKGGATAERVHGLASLLRQHLPRPGHRQRPEQHRRPLGQRHSGNGNNGGRLNVTGSIYLRSGTLTYGGGPDLTVNGNILVGNYAGNGNPGVLQAQGCNFGAGPPGGGIHLLH